MATIAADEFPPPPPGVAPPDWAVLPELRVTDPVACQLLGKAESRRYLLPFLPRSCTVQTVARHLQVKPQAMQYWVGRFVEAGLLRPWGVERRGRHRIQWYRGVALCLRVGLDQLPIEDFEDVLACMSERFERLARTSVAHSVASHARDLALTIRHQGAAGSLVEVQPWPGRTVHDDFIAYWARLWLRDEDELALRNELDALWERYAARSQGGEGRRPVLLHLTQVRDRTL